MTSKYILVYTIPVPVFDYYALQYCKHKRDNMKFVITRQATSPRELQSYTVNSHHNTEKLPSYTLSTLYIPGMTTLILSIYRCILSYDGI